MEIKDEKNKKWVCSVYGYGYFGENPPEKYPIYQQTKEDFILSEN